MSASSRRTLDTDNITLRQVFARGPQNVPIQSTLVLTADGRGGTNWVHPSSLGAYSLNYISTDVGRIQWDLSLNNVFYLTGGQGVGIQSSVTNPHQAIVYSKAYQAFKDQFGNVMTPFDLTGNLLNSTVALESSGWQIQPTVIPRSQTILLKQASTQFLLHNLMKVNSNSVYEQYEPSYFDNVNSTIHLMGVKDIQLSTILKPQMAIVFQISTFTSEGYLDLSGQVSSLRALSTVIPYSYRSTFKLNSNNSLMPGIHKLSTPYTGIFAYKVDGIPEFYSTIQSTIGYPFIPQGLRGTGDIAKQIVGPIIYEINEQPSIPLYTGDAYVSSLTFSLASFSSVINRNSNTNIQVQYTPSFLLPFYQSNDGINYLTNISSYITYGDIPVAGTTSQNVFYTPHSNLSNSAQMSLNLTIPHTFAINNYTSNYTVYHRFLGGMQGVSNLFPVVWPPLNWAYLRSGLSTTQFQNLTGATNQATISIIGI